tara:strand:- start:3842 stop:5260 length:1419 start_codon:yes stop_codon:yes gene_type:complete
MSRPSVVLVHKVPAIWEVKSKSNLGNILNLTDDFNDLDNLSEEENNLLLNLESDIFFLLAKSISDYLDISNVNIILGHNSDEKRNWEIISRIGKIKYGDKFNFWSINSPDIFPKIDNVKVLIVRGNYPNFHNELMSQYSPSTTIFYPATSLFFPHVSDRMKLLTSKSFKGKIHEDDLLEIISNFSKYPIFSKIKIPEIKSKPTSLDLIEFRKLFNNYSESVISKVEKLRNKVSVGKYPIVLFDEEKNISSLKNIYPNSRLLKFNKAASPIFSFDINSKRDIDVIYTGTTIQRTKNSDLFYEIIDGLIKLNPEIKVAIVGVDDISIPINKRWRGNVEIHGRISKSELCSLFNRSKIHLITSGRDCFPRTIPESIVCGCFLLTLDILSDGLSVISNNPLIGKVIISSDDILVLRPSNSVSLKLKGNRLVNDIFEQLQIERNHLLISTLGNELFPIGDMVQLDMIWQEIDLNVNE